MRSVLFVCTGNYYRSRMAEEIFNYQAHRYTLNWRADSAGLRADMSASPNEGPISKHAKAMLEKGNYPVTSSERYPRSINAEDFEVHDIIICLNQPEHEPMIRRRFPAYSEDVIYWEVADVEQLEPKIAFQRIVFNVRELILSLR